MPYIQLLSLPIVLYAHQFQAESYHKQFDLSNTTLEITYITEGEFLYTCGETAFTVGKGDILCALRDQKTAVSAKGFHQHRTVVAKVDRRLAPKEGALLLPAHTPAAYHTEKICRLIDELVYQELFYQSSAAHGAAKFLELLCAIDQCNRKKQTGALSGEQQYAERAKRYVQEHIHQTLTQSAIAAHLGISKEYLCAVFKRSEGTTLMQYINRLKLQGIQGLMEEGNLRLYEAAALYGYSDPNYVSKLYKQLFGHNITARPTVFE